MDIIEIRTPESHKLLPVLRDAIERQKQLLSQSLARTQQRIDHLAAVLQVNPDLLMAGAIPHSDEQDMDLLELEGELELRDRLREQLDSLERSTLCP